MAKGIGDVYTVDELQNIPEVSPQQVNLPDVLTDATTSTEGLLPGQTPIRITSPAMRSWKNIQGVPVDNHSDRPANRRNFFFVEPGREKEVIKKQWQNYLNKPTRYGLSDDSTISDAVHKFDQENPQNKINHLEGQGIDTNMKIKDARNSFDLSFLNPFAATEAQADEMTPNPQVGDVVGLEQLQPEQQNQYGNRVDGTPKGKGYFGELQRPDGSISTEISIGVNIDGKETEIPSLVPTLTDDEKKYLLSGEKPTPAIIEKAVKFAHERIKSGKSPFAGNGEQASSADNVKVGDTIDVTALDPQAKEAPAVGDVVDAKDLEPQAPKPPGLFDDLTHTIGTVFDKIRAMGLDRKLYDSDLASQRKDIEALDPAVRQTVYGTSDVEGAFAKQKENSNRALAFGTNSLDKLFFGLPSMIARKTGLDTGKVAEVDAAHAAAAKVGQATGDLGGLLSTGAALNVTKLPALAKQAGQAGAKVWAASTRFLPKAIMTSATFGTDAALQETVKQADAGKFDPLSAGKEIAEQAGLGGVVGAVGGIVNVPVAVLSATGIGAAYAKAKGADDTDAALNGAMFGLFELVGGMGRDRALREATLGYIKNSMSDWAIKKNPGLTPQDAGAMADQFIQETANEAGGIDKVLSSKENTVGYLEKVNQRIQQAIAKPAGFKPTESPETIKIEALKGVKPGEGQPDGVPSPEFPGTKDTGIQTPQAKDIEDKLIEQAHGPDDSASARAARRILSKQGINYKNTFTKADKADITNLHDWESSQEGGQRWSFINAEGQREVSGAPSAHSEAVQEVGPKAGMELLRRAQAGDKLTDIQTAKVHSMLADYRKNIKASLEEVTNARAELTDSEAEQVHDQFKKEGGYSEADWEAQEGFKPPDSTTSENKDSGTVAENVTPYTKNSAPTFYSHLERTIQEKMPNAAPADQVRGILKSAGVKQDEMDHLDMEGFLKDNPKPTKAQVLEHVRANNVELKEVEKGAHQPKQEAYDAYNGYVRELLTKHDPSGRMNLSSLVDTGELSKPEMDRLEELNQAIKTDRATNTKFQSYQLPGGENYRELLLNLPEKNGQPFIEPEKLTQLPEGYDLIHDQNAKEGRAWAIIPPGQVHGKAFAGWHITQDAAKKEAIDTLNFNLRYEAEKKYAAENKSSAFKSGHFEEPNVLAHVRMNDRTDADGKKVLFIEEVQSDWHQKGRKSGYKPKEYKGKFLAKKLPNGEWSVFNERGQTIITAGSQEYAQNAADQYNREGLPAHLNDDRNGGVPDAPFKKTWHELALKRMLRYAAENGYDKLAWTTGAQQAERYDLSKQVEKMGWMLKGSDGQKRVEIYPNSGSPIVLDINKNGIVSTTSGRGELEGKKLEDIVGKDIAEKIQKEDIGFLKGEGLKVGGEGMKGFYDQILPSFMNKYAKRWGGRVGPMKVSHPEEYPGYTYKGPEYDLAKLEEGLKIAQSSGPDKFTSPFTGQKQKYAVNRVSVAGALQTIIQSIENGDSFQDALAQHGSGEITELFGGELVQNKPKEEVHTVHGIDINPSLRESVMQQGQALFENSKEYGKLSKESESAYGSDAKQSRAIRAAVFQARRSATAGGDNRPALALPKFAKEFERNRKIDFVGRDVKDNKDAAELAALMRSPFIEHFQVMFVKDGILRAHQVLSSGQPNYVHFKDLIRLISSITAAARRLDVTEIYLAHNHPTGDPTPSQDDIKLTHYLGHRLQQNGITIKGHIVTDGNKYAVINAATLTDKSLYKTESFAEAKPDYGRNISNLSISTAMDAVREAKAFHKPGRTTVLFINAKNQIIHADTLGNDKNIVTYTNQMLEAYKAPGAIVMRDFGLPKNFDGLSSKVLEVIEVGKLHYQTIPFEPLASPLETATRIREDQAPYGKAEPPAEEEGKPPADKERKFIETVRESENTHPEVAQTVESRYPPITNKATMDAAQSYVTSDYNAALDLVMSDATPTAFSNAVAIDLIRRTQNEGRLADAVTIVEHTAAKLTALGQAIQAMSMYNRLSPDGILLAAARAFNKAKEKLPPQKIKQFEQLAKGLKGEDRDKLAKRLGIPHLSEQLAEDLLKDLNRISDMPDGRAKDIETAKVLKRIADEIPKSFWDKVSMVQTIAQLLNPKTFVRNLLGNLGFQTIENLSDNLATAIDIATALKTGKRTVGLPSASTQVKGAVQGFLEGKEEALHGIDLKGGAQTKFTLPKNGVFDTGVMGALEKTLRISLGATDRAFYQAAFNDHLRQQMMFAKVTDPTPEMIERAHMFGLYRTFQDDNIISRQFVTLKKWFNFNQRWGLGDMVLKYPKTPANILARGLEYSPFGFFHTMYRMIEPTLLQREFNQEAFSRGTARALTGSVLLAGVGALLGSLGIMSGRRSKDKDVQNTRQNVGIRDYQINVSALKRFVMSGMDPDAAKLQEGDVFGTYDWFQPQSISLALGANMVLDPNSSLPDRILNTGERIMQASETLQEQPLVQGVKTLFSKEDVGQGLIDVAKGIPSSFVPTLVSQVRQMADNTSRNTQGVHFFDEAYNKAINRIPGASGNLPPRVTTLGQPQEMYQAGSNNPFNVFLNPAFVNVYKPDPTSKMVLDIWERSGNTIQFPRVAPHAVKLDSHSPEKVRLDVSTYTAYQQYIGEKTDVAFKTLANNPDFMALPDDAKARQLQRILTDINQQAKQKVLIPGRGR